MIETQTLEIGFEASARGIAVETLAGAAPGLFWLGGFRSDMTGSKANALVALGERENLGVTRFDYSGHGRSGGNFLEGTIGRWLEEALAVFALTEGQQVVVGSSMGAWIALLLNRALRQAGNTRVAALVLIAPATDMTEELLRKRFPPAWLAALERDGVIGQPSAYSGAPYAITRELLAEGRNHLLFGSEIRTGCPVFILQGGRDAEVPQAHAHRLVAHLLNDPVTLTLVPDGDHRLSRPEDLALLERTVMQAVAGVRGLD